MPASKIEVDCLHVDQGMGTLVRVYDGIELTNLALLDFGSTTKGYKYADSALDAVIDALKKMKTPVIDMLLISHQDDDHWNLLGDLLTRIKAEAGLDDTEVNTIFRGGRLWSPKAKKALKEWEKEFEV